MKQKNTQNIMAFYNEFKNLNLALERGNVDNFVDDFVKKLCNDTFRNELIMKSYSTGTRTLAYVVSQADTITQSLRLHGIMGAKVRAGSGGMAGQGTFPKGKYFQPKRFSGGFSSIFLLMLFNLLLFLICCCF
jgi:hypothetical protein